jgi:hypothetical protein
MVAVLPSGSFTTKWNETAEQPSGMVSVETSEDVSSSLLQKDISNVAFAAP